MRIQTKYTFANRTASSPNLCVEALILPVTVFRIHPCMLSCFCHVWLSDPTDCSPTGSSVHGISQARILEWVPMPSARGSSSRRDGSCISCLWHWWHVGSLPLHHLGDAFEEVKLNEATRVEPWSNRLMSSYQETQESLFSLQVSRESHVRVQKSPIYKPGRELLSESKCAQNCNKINFWCLKLSFCSMLLWQPTQTGT